MLRIDEVHERRAEEFGLLGRRRYGRHRRAPARRRGEGITPLGRHQQGWDFARFSPAADRDLANADTCRSQKAEAFCGVRRCSRATIYIDDPISSLDEQNAVAVATHLAQMLKGAADPPKIVISTHHPLFFNVLWNELRKSSKRLFLSRSRSSDEYAVRVTEATPFFHHVANLVELHEVAKSGEIFTHHFNMLRAIAEKTASFHGYDNFADCIKRDETDIDGVLHTRLLNLLSHGGYSLYEPREMLDENKQYFRKMLDDFTSRFAFNPALLPPTPKDD
jgi:hypothetical protein